MKSQEVTPPPSPPEESHREKFRCLYMLVDAAVDQLEKELQQKKAEEGAASSTPAAAASAPQPQQHVAVITA